MHNNSASLTIIKHNLIFLFSKKHGFDSRDYRYALDTEYRIISDKLFELNIQWPNIKKAFIWHYGEVFEPRFISRIKEIDYDLILSGSKRPGLQLEPNFYFDLLFPLRYFRYYIGYYYLEELINNIN
jgi:hypothetical protein